MFSTLKLVGAILTLICYSNMVLAEDIYRDLPENPYASNEEGLYNDIPVNPYVYMEDLYTDIPVNPYDLDLQKQLWNESLVTDAESWDREQHNNKFSWDKEDNLDPLFGLDLLLD